MIRFPCVPTFSTGLIVVALAALATLSGCASGPGMGPPAAPSPVLLPEPLPSLAAEQRWLADWFRGTPVVIVSDDAGSVWVEVPQPHAFDAGQSQPRPALAAVLDRVIVSLRRQPTATVVIAAPADGANAGLARTRANKLREYLNVRGVLAQRISIAEQPAPALARLQLVPAAENAASSR